jgi:hypothetical protein
MSRDVRGVLRWLHPLFGHSVMGVRDLYGVLRLLRLAAALGMLTVLGLRLSGMLAPEPAQGDLGVLFIIWLLVTWIIRLRSPP